MSEPAATPERSETPGAMIYIARDGAEIGAFSEAELDASARAGELLPNDFFWQQGMEDWRRLDELLDPGIWSTPPPRPAAAPAQKADLKKQLVTAGLVSAAVLVVIGIGIFFATRREDAPPVRPRSAIALEPGQENETREKAAAELRSKIDRLPAQASPPLNTFYYDIAVEMRRSLAPHTTWEAMVRGNEDAVDSETQQTIRHTAFRLTTAYRDGTWVFDRYHGSTRNLVDGSQSEDEHDANSPAPPLIVGLLGLKIVPFEPERH